LLLESQPRRAEEQQDRQGRRVAFFHRKKACRNDKLRGATHPQPKIARMDSPRMARIARIGRKQKVPSVPSVLLSVKILADCADSLSALAHGRVSRSFGVRCACPERSRRILAALLTRVAASRFRNP